MFRRSTNFQKSLKLNLLEFQLFLIRNDKLNQEIFINGKNNCESHGQSSYSGRVISFNG